MRELVGFEMRETDADVEYLQRLMDDTFAGANPHMTSIVTPEKRLRATQVVRYLDGIQYAAFGSATQAGEPRVSPLDTLFVRGRFTLSTDGSAARVTNLRHNPACSLVHMVADTIAIVVHGKSSGSRATMQTMTRSNQSGHRRIGPTCTPGATRLSSSVPSQPRCGHTPNAPASSPSSTYRPRPGSSSLAIDIGNSEQRMAPDLGWGMRSSQGRRPGRRRARGPFGHVPTDAVLRAVEQSTDVPCVTARR